MYEEDVTNPVETHPHAGATDHSSIVKYVLLGVALLYVLASLYFMYTLKGRLDALDQKQQTLESAQTELSARLHSTKSEFKEALTSEVGLTKQEIARRAAELERQQKAGEAKLVDLHDDELILVGIQAIDVAQDDDAALEPFVAPRGNEGRHRKVRSRDPELGVV